jgi:phage terminase small subunit
MPGKTTPIVIYQPALAPEPPPQLGSAGSDLWRSILAEWDISDAASLALLADACAARDTAERLRLQIQDAGDVITLPSGSSKANPLLMVELTARNLTARLLGRLGLLDTGDKRGPGRPPKPGGW